jgi:hypothetical protein
MLQDKSCYNGSINGRADDAQKSLMTCDTEQGASGPDLRAGSVTERSAAMQSPTVGQLR